MFTKSLERSLGNLVFCLACSCEYKMTFIKMFTHSFYLREHALLSSRVIWFPHKTQ